MFNGYLKFDVHKCTKAKRMLRFDSKLFLRFKICLLFETNLLLCQAVTVRKCFKWSTYILAQEYKITSSS